MELPVYKSEKFLNDATRNQSYENDKVIAAIVMNFIVFRLACASAHNEFVNEITQKFPLTLINLYICITRHTPIKS
jgi:hypothetical protein